MEPLLSFEELKQAYLDYFKQVKSDVVSGRGRIRHVKACMELVREGKLIRNTDKSFSLKH